MLVQSLCDPYNGFNHNSFTLPKSHYDQERESRIYNNINLNRSTQVDDILSDRQN